MDKLVGAFSGVLKSSGTPIAQPQPTQGDRQYLRLPLESARKLRWFEKADLQALTKAQFREKRELLDTIAVLKKVLLRNGLEDAKLDAEVAAHLRSAEELQEEHEGVASVLMTALESHVQELRFENDRLRAAIKTSQQAAVAAAAERPDNPAFEAPSGSGGAADAISVAGCTSGQPLAVGSLLPRRLDPLNLAQLSGRGAAPRMDAVAKHQMASLESQCEELSKQVLELKTALAKQQQQQQAAARRRAAEGSDASRAQMQDVMMELQETAREEARKAARAEARATRLEGELKALQGQHRTLSKEHGTLQQQLAELQDQAEAAAAAAEAKAAAAAAAGEGAKAVAEAREEAAGLRQALADVQAELATAQATISRLDTDLQLTQHREAAAAAALAEAEAVARRSDELAATNLQLSQRLAESRAELEMAAYFKKVCGELTEAKSRLEDHLMGLAALLSASEVKVADMAARVQAAEEQLAAAESRARAAESSVAAEVERRCGAVLSCRALWPPQLREEVFFLESRAAELEREHTAAVKRADAAAAGEQVLREELRTTSETLTALMEESTAATAAAAEQLQQLREALAGAQARTAGLQDDLAAERSRSRAQEEQLAAAAAAVSAGTRLATHGSNGSLQSGGGGGGGFNRQSSSGCNGAAGPGSGAGALAPAGASTAVITPKWQVQNKVGSGSLYNLNADTGDGAAPGGGGGPARGGRGAGSGAAGGVAGTVGGSGASVSVDTVYMKNVLFKFLEAHLTNKVQERDMLLPAVATLLQASQEEFVALQKILKATQPPSRQMLSVLGLTR